MELNELKSFWQSDKQKLEARIEANEKLLQKLGTEKVITQFDNMLKMSVLGRNLALVYGLLSVIKGVYAFNEFVIYSIPCILGGLAMFGSFIAHLAIKKPNYQALSTADLQKSIVQFRLHTAKMFKYDMGVVLVWFLTLAPLYFKETLKISIYSNPTLLLSLLLLIIVSAVLSKFIYKKIDNQLKESEEQLNGVLVFEKML